MFDLNNIHVISAYKSESDKGKTSLTYLISYVTNNLICQEMLHKIIGLLFISCWSIKLRPLFCTSSVPTAYAISVLESTRAKE